MTTLYCALCLYVREEPEEAVTVVNGQAVCADHMGYVGGGEHATALYLVRDQEGGPS